VRPSQLKNCLEAYIAASSFFKHQHSEPYVSTGNTNDSCSLIFVLLLISFDVHNLPSLPNIADASPNRFLMSVVHLLSSVSIPPGM